MKPKSGKSSGSHGNTWNDPWAEEGVWLGGGSDHWGASDDVMSMDHEEVVTTPPPDYGWVGSSGGSSGLVKPKSAKSASSTSWVDNNWLNPNGGVENVWNGHEGWSSKSSKDVSVIGVPTNDGFVSSAIQSSKSAKTMWNGSGHEEVMMTSKSAKSHYIMSINDQDIIQVPNGIKVTSKTGKGSYYTKDGHAVMISKSAKSHYVMSMDDAIIQVPNGIKVDSKTGKASHLNNGQVMMVSKSAKHSYPMSYSHQLESAISGAKVAAKTSKKSSKSAKADTHPVMSVDYLSKSSKGIHYHSNMSIDYVSKSAKSSDLYMSVNPIYIASKSAKSLDEASSRDYSEAKMAKTGKSVHLMSVDYSQHTTVGSKSSKGSKSSTLSMNYDEESGEVWISKSSKSSSKSSKSSLEDNIIITPEEAGLPFRAKSSKSIPLRHIHNIQDSSSMPIKVSPSNSLTKQHELKKETIVREDGTTMSVEEYNAMYKPPRQQSGTQRTLIRRIYVVASLIAAGYLM